jgi:hypothetical protein
MPDTSKRPGQSTETTQSAQTITDLPSKPITDQDAQAVKGGVGGVPRMPEPGTLKE